MSKTLQDKAKSVYINKLIWGLMMKSFKQLVGEMGEYLSVSLDDGDATLTILTDDGLEYELSLDKNALTSIYNQLDLLLDGEDEDDEEEEAPKPKAKAKPKGKKK